MVCIFSEISIGPKLTLFASSSHLHAFGRRVYARQLEIQLELVYVYDYEQRPLWFITIRQRAPPSASRVRRHPTTSHVKQQLANSRQRRKHILM